MITYGTISKWTPVSIWHVLKNKVFQFFWWLLPSTESSLKFDQLKNPVVETMVVTDTMSGKWILVSFAIKRRGILNKWQSKLQYKIEYYMLSCLAPYSQVFNFNNYDNGLSWIVLYDVQDHEFCVIRRVIVMHLSSSVSESGVLKASKSVQNTVINSLFSHDWLGFYCNTVIATNYCHNELVGGGWLCCRLVFTVTKWIHILMWDPLGWSSFFNG